MEELESKQGGEIMSWKEIKIKDILGRVADKLE